MHDIQKQLEELARKKVDSIEDELKHCAIDRDDTAPLTAKETNPGIIEARISEQDIGGDERIKLNRARWRLRRGIRRERARGRWHAATLRPARSMRTLRPAWRPDEVRSFFEAKCSGEE